MVKVINVAIELPESYTMDNLGASLGRTFNTEQLEAFFKHPNIVFNAGMLGLSNKWKDSHAGITVKSHDGDEAATLLAKKAKIESGIAAVMNGEWRVARVGAPKLSGLDAIIARESRKHVIAAYQNALAKANKPKANADQVAEWLKTPKAMEAIAKVSESDKLIAKANELYEIEKMKAAVADDVEVELDL